MTRKSVFNDLEDPKAVQEELNSRVTFTDDSETREYPVVTMLGTSACVSSKLRNVSGILVETSKDSYMVMDCGHGTLAQITALYGVEKTDEILRNLKGVFISHGHVDHHGGILRLMDARKQAFYGKSVPLLYLIYPKKLSRWLELLHKEFDQCMEGVRSIHGGFLVKDAVFPSNYRHGNSQFLNPLALMPTDRKEMNDYLGLKDVSTIIVQHAYAISCYGICITHQDYKMVYSGDTMPCDDLIEAAQGADLLIHEATFGDALLKDAKLKTHCTTSQAVDVAQRSNAKFTLLTHFCVRYPRLPCFNEQLFNSDNVGIAFDSMVVRPKDLPNTTMKSLYGAASAMHPTDVDRLKESRVVIEQLKLKGMSPEKVVKVVNKTAAAEVEYNDRLGKRKIPSPSADTDRQVTESGSSDPTTSEGGKQNSFAGGLQKSSTGGQQVPSQYSDAGSSEKKKRARTMSK